MHKLCSICFIFRCSISVERKKVRIFQIQETKKLGVLKGKMNIIIEISDSSRCFLTPIMKKLNFGKKRGQIQGVRKKKKKNRGINDQNDYQY